MLRREDHPRIRLPEPGLDLISANAVLGMCRTKVHAVDRRAFGREDPFHPVGQAKKIVFRIVAAPDPRLVRHHDAQISQRLGGSGKLENSVQKDKFLDLENIAVVAIDHPIAIQEQRAILHLQIPESSS
ncbi:hypothetical protein BMMON2_50270 [Burkholderia mallei]